MSSFTSQPWFEPIIDSKFWLVKRGFTYHITSEYGKDKIVIPVGFETDFASVPKLFWSIIPPWGRYGKAAVVHDYLYRTQTRTRKESDDIFLEAMGVLNVVVWKRTIMYLAVRWFGWFAWRKQ